MDNVVALQHGESHRQSDAVVGAQRRAAGLHPAIFDVGLYRVVQRVAHTYADHVHVVKQHDGFGSFVAWCSGFADDYAVLFVALIRQAETFGKLAKIVGHALFVV